MDRLFRTIVPSFVALVLFASGCGRPSGDQSANQNSGAQSGSQSAPPLIVPKNQSQAGLGGIKVGSRPAGATITLIPEDEAGAGRPQVRGSTPAIITDLIPGKYTIHLELAGYKSFQKSVEVKPDETTSVSAGLTR